MRRPIRPVSASSFVSRHSYVPLIQARMLLGVTEAEMERLIVRGELVHVTFGGRRYMRKRDLKAQYQRRIAGT